MEGILKIAIVLSALSIALSLGDIMFIHYYEVSFDVRSIIGAGIVIAVARLLIDQFD